MADEYFLSAYLTPPGERSVTAPRHDHNVSLWRRGPDGVALVRHWELERISGSKHHSWPLYTQARAETFLNALLATEGLSLVDVSVSWGTPGLPAYQDIAMPPGSADFPVHSMAHLFSGLMLDTRIVKDGIVVAMALDAAPDLLLDGGPPPYWYVGCVADRGKLTFAPVESPGPLYLAAERLFGKEPGTLMALASACRSEITFDAVAATATPMLFGGRVVPWPAAARLLRSIVDEAERQLVTAAPDDRFSAEENLQSAVMKVVQRCCELITIRNVENLCALAGVRADESYLSLSGGFALNCPTNTFLLDRFSFRGLLTPPCANDSGQALGLGLLGLYGMGAFADADLRIETAYHGRDLGDVDGDLAEFAPWIAETTDFSAARFVDDIRDDVVVWVDGAAEMGPRALGHRSLLGDPRSMRVKDLLNEYKQRQWWRPVAPIVLAEHVGEWFEQTRPSPYMLEAVQVRPEQLNRVPAIPHLDGSARHQTITERDNPLLYRAIDEFRAATGVPMLCNTSLNDKGEPIVDNVAEALTFCVRKGIRIAYVAGRRIVLRGEPVPAVPAPAGPRTRSVEYFAGQEDERDAIWRSWMERGYTEGSMLLLTGSPQMITDPDRFTPHRVNLLAEVVAARDETFAQNLVAFRAQQGPGSSFPNRPVGTAPVR